MVKEVLRREKIEFRITKKFKKIGVGGGLYQTLVRKVERGESLRRNSPVNFHEEGRIWSTWTACGRKRVPEEGTSKVYK